MERPDELKRAQIKVDDLLPLAERGDATAQFEVAECFLLHMKCRMPAIDTVRAIAHNVGQKKAQEGQSVRRFTGSGIREEHKEKAVYWYEKAAAQGYVPAISALVNNYFVGRGVEKNEEKARQLAMNLFEKGEPEAIRLMAVVTNNPPTSRNIHWYAWGMVARKAGMPWVIDISRYEIDMTSEELAIAREKGDELIKSYMPLYGSKR